MALSKDCDDILNKIDELLVTEITTFDKVNDYRVGGQDEENDQNSFTE